MRGVRVFRRCRYVDLGRRHDVRSRRCGSDLRQDVGPRRWRRRRYSLGWCRRPMCKQAASH